MLERTYMAREIGEAFARIKRELGDDAVILSTRAVNQRVQGMEQTSYEIKAAPFGTLEKKAMDKMAAPRGDHRTATLEKRLLANGVPQNVARMLTMHARRSLREINGPMLEALTGAIQSEVSFAPKLGARIVALVGPTGVGKTTTVAKLAAVAALVERRSVALVCVDHYRVGASEQLQRYADLIGLPMESAFDAQSFNKALRKHARAQLVLVDTAGRSPRDTVGTSFTADILGSTTEPVEAHLCVAAATREAELTRIFGQHAPVKPSRLLVTKVDEALTCGSIVAAHAESGLPLSFLTTGQRVPEDLERACPEVLAALLHGEEA